MANCDGTQFVFASDDRPALASSATPSTDVSGYVGAAPSGGSSTMATGQTRAPAKPAATNGETPGGDWDRGCLVWLASSEDYGWSPTVSGGAVGVTHVRWWSTKDEAAEHRRRIVEAMNWRGESRDLRDLNPDKMAGWKNGRPK